MEQNYATVTLCIDAGSRRYTVLGFSAAQVMRIRRLLIQRWYPYLVAHHQECGICFFSSIRFSISNNFMNIRGPNWRTVKPKSSTSKIVTFLGAVTTAIYVHSCLVMFRRNRWNCCSGLRRFLFLYLTFLIHHRPNDRNAYRASNLQSISAQACLSTPETIKPRPKIRGLREYQTCGKLHIYPLADHCRHSTDTTVTLLCRPTSTILWDMTLYY